ncbi:MAG: hypothetical protein JSR76_02810 [Verrucomicrobia bacterium]|jgi:hypothetical protein|nr:hypothetical protein [Verrucomicrobiota bacterium]
MEDFQVEFLNFDETPEEKYLGVASLKIFGKIILRFKVQRTKDGNGMFVAIPSYRKTDQMGEQWCQWFMLDSSSQKEIVENLIKSKVKAYFKSKEDSSNSNSGGSFCSSNNYSGHSQKAASASNGWGSQAFAHRTA